MKAGRHSRAIGHRPRGRRWAAVVVVALVSWPASAVSGAPGDPDDPATTTTTSPEAPLPSPTSTTTTTEPTTTTTAPPTTTPGLAPAPGEAPPGARPTPSYVENPVGGRQRAAAYAYKWADSTNRQFALSMRGKITVPRDNPAQRGRAVDPASREEADCTSYMSQALRTGGFEATKKWNYNPKARTATVSWVRAGGPDGLPAVFVKMGRMRLMNPRGAGLGQPPPAGIQIGDVIAWDLYGGPMFIHHQLMVTEVAPPGRSWRDIRVSYHTYDHTNRAMDEYQATVTLDAPEARLYAFHVNYPS